MNLLNEISKVLTEYEKEEFKQRWALIHAAGGSITVHPDVVEVARANHFITKRYNPDGSVTYEAMIYPSSTAGYDDPE